MKVKNLTFVEKHIEKVAFVVCVLIASLVTVFMVFGTPYRVTVVSTGEIVTADNISEPLLAAVGKLEAALDGPSPLPPMVVQNYTEEFRNRIERGRTAHPNLETPLGRPGLDVRLFKEQDK